MSLEILVVDDDENFLALVKHIFEVYRDANVCDVGDSLTASTLVEVCKYDGIFLDLNMPGLDGFELALKIRATEINKRTPIIVITGEKDLVTLRKARAARATFVITKPVDHKALKRIFDATQGAMWAERRKR
jgi:twitching motility two-component system response regulator PilG